ncbi:MAG: transposase, partial [Thermocladium sp.]
MPSSGQFSKNGGRGPTSPAIPGEDIKEVKHSNKRTNVVRLLPNGFQERKLRRLANASAKLFNEVNYERRQQFFRGEKVDFEGTWDKCYEKYKEELGVNAQAVMQKNNEAWNSFFSLLKLRKENKLPPHMSHVSPPRYWKDGEAGGRKLLLVVRQDRYVVDEEELVLKDYHLEISFAGGLRWHGKQGRLEIYYDETRNAWYASIPVEVGVEVTKTGRKSKHVVRGERKSIQVKSPKGNKAASIDLGINVLASVVIDDGTWLLYKGVRAKEDYFYFGKRISEAQSSADKVKNLGEYEAYYELNRERRRLFKKLTKRLLHLYRNFASHLLKALH